ncbi:MAG: DUF2073 domain-containing protein [Candidatus Micrarchaeia archaeon]
MGVQIEFISSSVLEPKGEEKINYIIESIKENRIVVLEKPLTISEEKRLIEETMRQINTDFTGIEVSTLGRNEESGLKGLLIRLLGGKVGGLTVIGPSNLVKKVKRNADSIELFAISGRRR